MRHGDFTNWYTDHHQPIRSGEPASHEAPAEGSSHGRSVKRCGISDYLSRDQGENEKQGVEKKPLFKRVMKRAAKEVAALGNRVVGNSQKTSQPLKPLERMDEVSGFLPEFSGQLAIPSDGGSVERDLKKELSEDIQDFYKYIEGSHICDFLIKVNDEQVKCIQLMRESIDCGDKSDQSRSAGESLWEDLTKECKEKRITTKTLYINKVDEDFKASAEVDKDISVMIDEMYCGLQVEVDKQAVDFNRRLKSMLKKKKGVAIKELDAWKKALETEKEFLEKQQQFEKERAEAKSAKLDPNNQMAGAFGQVSILKPEFMSGPVSSSPGGKVPLFKKLAIKAQTVPDEQKQDFRMEVKTHRQSTAPIKLHGVWKGKVDGKHKILMDAMATDLLRLVEKKPAVLKDPGFRRTVARGVVGQLARLHRQGIVHRDIKPQNVMMNPDTGEVSIIDYGVAQYTADASGLQGSPAYIAPEVWKSGRVSLKVDSWSVGIMLCDFIFGQRVGGQFDRIVGVESERDYNKRVEKYHDSLLARVKANVDLREYNLIRGLLSLDPNKRLSCENALKHQSLKKLATHSDLAQMHREKINELAQLEKAQTKKDRVMSLAADQSSNKGVESGSGDERGLTNFSVEKEKTRKDIKDLQSAMRWMELDGILRKNANDLQEAEEKYSKATTKELKSELKKEIQRLELQKTEFEEEYEALQYMDNPYIKQARR